MARLPGSGAEDGQIAILILGLFAITLVLILGAIDVTAAQLGRMRLLDVADAVALDAADALDEEATYARGVTETPVLTNASVREAAEGHLAQTPRPAGLEMWTLGPDTGTPDGRTAVVTLTGRAMLPMTGWILESLGGSVTITVESRARAPLR
ncbi:MAG TPA: pilus assembly protein TadG-related protein [Dermatophilaceae bacterium]|nr:pilus assembly protein TadG-related protein [Dermatophilaceae bacterium]